MNSLLFFDPDRTFHPTGHSFNAQGRIVAVVDQSVPDRPAMQRTFGLDIDYVQSQLGNERIAKLEPGLRQAMAKPENVAPYRPGSTLSTTIPLAPDEPFALG
jgi:hypothetical protein